MIVARCGLAVRSAAETFPVEPMEKYTAPSGPTATLFRACIGPAQFRTAGVGQAGGEHAAIGGPAVGIGCNRRSDRPRPRRGCHRRTPGRAGWLRPSSSVETVGPAGPGRGATPGPRRAQRPAVGVRCPDRQPGMWDSRPHRHAPPRGQQGVAGVSSGAAAKAAGTVTAVGARPFGTDAPGAGGGAGWLHATPTDAATMPTTAPARQACMHLPDQDLRVGGGREPPSTGSGEPHGVTLGEVARVLECHRSARDEQMQIRRIGKFDRIAGAQPRAVQRGVPVADVDRGRVAVSGMPEAMVTSPR